MKTVFIISDTHFGHANICGFKRADGITALRPWTDVTEMDEAMVERWNSRVKPTDKVYHLGDVVINRRALSTLTRLNGDKVLIKGNHDIFQLADYAQHFRDVRGYHVLNGMIFSHIPVHDSALYRFGTNIHGHLHDRRVLVSGTNDIDPRYISACVEQIDYTPISLEEIQDRIRAQGGVVGFRNGNSPQAD
jgi:calcineurin-like phosphoesterase family protein